MINPQLIDAFVECLVEFEDLALSTDLSKDDYKEMDFLRSELARILQRIILEATHEKK